MAIHVESYIDSANAAVCIELCFFIDMEHAILNAIVVSTHICCSFDMYSVCYFWHYNYYYYSTHACTLLLMWPPPRAHKAAFPEPHLSPICG